VALLPSTPVEAAVPPLVTHSTESAPPAEAHPLGAEGLAMLEPDTSLNNSLIWAERVELEEAENCAFSPIFPPQNPEDGQRMAPMPPCPPPVLRPTLQVRDVVTAVRSTPFIGDAHHLLPALLDRYVTDLSPSELATRMDFMWSLRRDLTLYLRERILQGYLVYQPPGWILAELLQLLEMLSADPH